jgi:hypothetical protein
MSNIVLDEVEYFDTLSGMPRSENEWSYTSTTPIRLHGAVLSYWDNFTFTFNFTVRWLK